MLGKNKLSTTEVFGRVLRGLRKEKRFSQETLAFEANLQRNYISLIELGVNQPTISTVFKLANALGVKPHELILKVEDQIIEEGF